MYSERLNMEEDQRMLQALATSPTRTGPDGQVTFVGRQEYEDEQLRSHYLLQMIRSKDESFPHIQREGNHHQAEE